MYLHTNIKSYSYTSSLIFNIGTCSHLVTVVENSTEIVDFDSSKLDIEKITINGDEVFFRIASVDLQLGSKISITIPKVGIYLFVVIDIFLFVVIFF